MDERLTIIPGRSREAGACNFCNRYGVDPETMERPDHAVYTVRRDSGSAVAVRFCAACLRDLVRLAAGTLPPAQSAAGG